MHNMDFTIEAEDSASDIAAIALILTEAYEQPKEAQLVAALRNSADFIPSLSLIAHCGGEPAGYALLHPIRIEREGLSHASLALAPVAVIQRHQRKGIGSALVRELLQRARQQDHGSVIVLGEECFYSRFGFRPSIQWGIRCPFDVPDNLFMVVELRENALRGIRGTVTYPDAFMLV